MRLVRDTGIVLRNRPRHKGLGQDSSCGNSRAWATASAYRFAIRVDPSRNVQLSKWASARVSSWTSTATLRDAQVIPHVRLQKVQGGDRDVFVV